MPLTAEIKVKLTAAQVGANDFGGPSFDPAVEALLQLADGVGANQADQLWIDERTVADGATDAIDLDGSLTDALGAAFTPAEVVAILIINKRKSSGTANTTALTIGGGSNPYLAEAVPAIAPGGVVLLASPGASGLGAVTADTGDLLNIVNAAGAANTYQIAVLARSA